ncbi:hypothetical protein F4806DRAFT_176505 [Annulohypoxylon nitens]|nr:hypothetical protein F4806DRAFT_176505 [Annulohypoxylon nitens]
MFLVYSRYRKLLVNFHVVILIVTWCNFPMMARVKLDGRRVSLSTAPVYKLVHMMARGIYSESWNDKEANPNSSTPTLRSKGFFGIGRSKVIASPSRPSWQSTGQGATYQVNLQLMAANGCAVHGQTGCTLLLCDLAQLAQSLRRTPGITHRTLAVVWRSLGVVSGGKVPSCKSRMGKRPGEKC